MSDSKNVNTRFSLPSTRIIVLTSVVRYRNEETILQKCRETDYSVCRPRLIQELSSSNDWSTKLRLSSHPHERSWFPEPFLHRPPRQEPLIAIWNHEQPSGSRQGQFGLLLHSLTRPQNTCNEWYQILTMWYDYPLLSNLKDPEPLLESAGIVAAV